MLILTIDGTSKIGSRNNQVAKIWVPDEVHAGLYLPDVHFHFQISTTLLLNDSGYLKKTCLEPGLEQVH